MKKTILSAIIVMAVSMTTFSTAFAASSPIKLPACGCNDPKAKNVTTPDTQLTEKEKAIKKIILSNPKINLPGVTFTENRVNGPCHSGDYTNSAQQQWANAVRDSFAAEGYNCPCIDYDVHCEHIFGRGWTCLSCAFVVWSNTPQCSCINDLPF